MGLGFIFGIFAVLVLGIGTCMFIDEYLLEKKDTGPVEPPKTYLLDASKSEQVYHFEVQKMNKELGYIKVDGEDYLVTYVAGATEEEADSIKIGDKSFTLELANYDGGSIYLLPNAFLLKSNFKCADSALTIIGLDLSVILNIEKANEMFINWQEGHVGYYKNIANNSFAEYHISFDFNNKNVGSEEKIKDMETYPYTCEEE